MSLEKDSFSEEEQHLFERRYEEGYDIADMQYQKWLQQRKAISVNLSNSPPLQSFNVRLVLCQHMINNILMMLSHNLHVSFRKFMM